MKVISPGEDDAHTGFRQKETVVLPEPQLGHIRLSDESRGGRTL